MRNAERHHARLVIAFRLLRHTFRPALFLFIVATPFLDVSGQPVAQHGALGPSFDDPQQFGSFDPIFGPTPVTISDFIDSALLQNRLRFRVDAAYNNRLPDRAEFFYAQCGCLGGNAPGPPLAETSVDYQDFRVYGETTWSDRYAAFFEAPLRFLNPELNQNTTGLGDVNVGIKYAMRACHGQYLTAQLRIYLPLGDADRGLGTDHFTFEPGLLLRQSLSDRLTVEGEVHYWIPWSSQTSTNGTQFYGEILHYGLGLGYDLHQDCYCSKCGECHGQASKRLTSVVEVVGWSIMNGNVSNSNLVVQDADGTIGNIMFGLRWSAPGDSVYVGYGHSFVGDAWYEHIVRLEYEYRF